MARRPLAIGVFCMVVAVTSAAAAAQYNTASITGLVRDQQAGAIAGAGITAVHVATGLIVSRVTDAGGRFVLPELPIGAYTLTVSHPGFAPFRRDDLALAARQSLEIHVTLIIASVTDTVTVSAASIVRTVGSEMQDIISSREVAERS
jgi:hypothetical protein